MLQPKQLALIVLLGAVGTANSSASVLCARVADFSRLPLTSASVVATDLVTGKTYKSISDKGGRACFTKIPEGLYEVEAGLVGFLYVKYHPVKVTAAGPVELTVLLPIGEVQEGGVSVSSTLSGTLVAENGKPAESAKICLVSGPTFKRCMVTDELGEYAFVVPAAVYDVSVQIGGTVRQSTVDVSVPGSYRNRLSAQAGTDHSPGHSPAR